MSYATIRLVESLRDLHHAVHLHAMEPRPAPNPGIDATYYPASRPITSLGLSRPMYSALQAAARKADIMHFHGLWTMASVYPGWAARNTDVTLVMSPHGTLEPWARNWHRIRKNLFSIAAQRRVLMSVTLFHATSDAEANSIRAAGFTAPIAVVPIGIDIPPPAHRPTSQDRDRRAVYLGRLHPAKNIETLITAWTSVSARHPEWALTIAGPGNPSYVSELQRRADRADRIEFRGATYGTDKAELLMEADLLVLPSHNENFGIVVAEALSYGVPVVATDGAPWQSLETEGCGWWTQPNAEALAIAIDEAMSSDHETLDEMGRRGREWMERDFGWEVVARKVTDAYRWARYGGSVPSSVRIR